MPSLAEASRLFVERAAADPGFSPTEQDEATIDEICRRLDGMPLAIELAAARVPALSLDQIAARLGDSLDVLAAGSRTARTRQQTLRATIEWSHDLLTGEERVLFRRLVGLRRRLHPGGGRGRLRRRRHRAPADRRPPRRGWSTSRSSARPAGASACSTPSASTRPSASTPSGEHDTVAVRHLDWCLALAEEHDPLSAGPRRSLRTLETEHDNLRAALTFALRRDPQAALRLATSLWRFWLDRGYFAEGDRWLDAALVAAPERTAAARRGPAGQRRALAAQRRLRRSTCTAPRRRSPTTASWATSTRPPRPSTSTRCSSSRSATPRGPTSSSPTRSPSARRLGDRRLLAAATHASAMTPWYRSDHEQARAVGLRGARAPRGAPRRRHAVLRRGDVRPVPAARRAAGPSAPALRGDDLPLPPLRPRPGHRLCAQQPGLDGARDGRRRRRPRPRSTRPWSASAPSRTAAGEALTLNHMGNLARSQGDLDARPRPPARGARAAPRARREARDPR